MIRSNIINLFREDLKQEYMNKDIKNISLFDFTLPVRLVYEAGTIIFVEGPKCIKVLKSRCFARGIIIDKADQKINYCISCRNRHCNLCKITELLEN